MTRDELINEKLLLTEEELADPTTEIKLLIHKISAIQPRSEPVPPSGFWSFFSPTPATVQDPEVFVR
jgi:hypothetical protein